jgi:hypothetical protein
MPTVLQSSPQRFPFLLSIYSAGGYVPNSFDSCTAYNVVNLILSNYQENLVSGDTPPTGSGFLISGGASMILSASGSGNDGSFDLIYNLNTAGLEWLKDNGFEPYR